MPDIHMRFHTDMLVLASPADAALQASGANPETDREMLVANEPETMLEKLRLDALAGVQCLVTPTNGITRARLAHVGLEDHAAAIAKQAVSLLKGLSPQHILAEIGPTRLPIDPTSKRLLSTNRDQYADAARAFDGLGVDALLLNGMVDLADLRCALMGVRMVTDIPVFAVVALDETGTVRGRTSPLEEAVALMAEYGADVMGFSTQAPIDDACALAERACQACDAPLLVALDVREVCKREFDAGPNNPYWNPDTMLSAAPRLQAAGVQFMRAQGAATSTYAGALAAASAGLPSLR